MTNTCDLCGANDSSLHSEKNGFRILKCRVCGLAFTEIPSGFDLDSIYDASYFQGGQSDGYVDYLGSESTLRCEFRGTVNLLRKVTSEKPGLKLLEIGCAYGFFIREAMKYFECHGIEISDDSREFCKKRGLSVLGSTVTNEVLSLKGPFDVVVMLDVIEHLPSPKETIDILVPHLNPGGIILVVTGDVDSMLARATGNFWRLLTPPQHTFFFSKTTLSRLFTDSGFSIVRRDRPWKRVPLGLAAYQLGSRSGIRLKSLEGLTSGLPVNLFDTIRIVARKK